MLGVSFNTISELVQFRVRERGGDDIGGARGDIVPILCSRGDDLECGFLCSCLSFN